MTILLISDNEPNAFACSLLAEELRKRGQSCITTGALSRKKESPLPNVKLDIQISLEALLGSDLLRKASAIGVFIKSPDDLRRFAESYRNLANHSGDSVAPIFSGPLEVSAGDRLMEQFHKALCCDYLLLPGDNQLQELATASQHWEDSTAKPKLVKTGLWFMPERPPQGSLSGNRPKEPYRLLFLAQDVIPTIHGGKAQILRQLITWAEASPNWTIIIQKDWSTAQNQSWIPRYKPEEWPMPDNIHFAAPGQLLTHLADCTACMTVSSTWSLTAMAWGRKAMIIGDYGIHTDQGTTSWFGCGAMNRLNHLKNLDELLELPGHNQTWLESMGWGVHDGIDRLLTAINTFKS